MTSFRLRIMMQVLPFLLITPGLALAQAPPTRGQAAAALSQPNNPANNPAATRYSRQQIDQMVAPIALYPDQLLSQVLMAATYPPQIVEVAQWLEQPGNAELKGDALVAALQPLAWDPSVKGLVAFPQVIGMLSEHIEWTQTLGVAFAAQQPEVMGRVQALRQLAMKSGGIKQLRHLTVRQEGPAVVIVQAEPERIYVPVYNPMVMYGAWPDRAYPPVFLPPPRRFVLETIAPGIQVGVGYGIVAPLWGWSRPNWRSQQITINRVEYTRITQNVNVQIGPGDGWRRSGPVVLAAPAAARAPAAAVAMPAGTVAPTAAAAVVNMPQKAASQPTLIQTQKTAAQPATDKPATDKPGTTQPGQAQTNPAKPDTAGPGQAKTTPAKPDTAEPGQAKTTPAKPDAMQPGQAQTTPAKPATEKPGQAQTTPDTAQPGQRKAATSPTETAPNQPGKVQGTATAPAAKEPKERGPASSAAKPAEPAAKSAPERAGVKEPAGAQEPTPRTPERAGAASGAPPTTRQAPEQAGPKPTAGPPAQGMAPSAGPAGQRAAPEGVRQGSSAPPDAQSTQQPKREPAGARGPGRPGPDDGDKKER